MRALIAVAAIAVLLSVGLYAPRYLARQERKQACQIAKDELRRQIPNSALVAFADCLTDDMYPFEMDDDVYHVSGHVYVYDSDGNSEPHLFGVNVWRTADGWEADSLIPVQP